ncbi:Murein DD-endopeptidase MepM and murein hydrolase activator NlpD, contain LysM domain [Peptoclostridium litorale DSM 5388]|uniref:Peptidase M23B n=1 Tax=Peptoclostridium litorale DSM 5388 TaxID=1121324 RepID=A0A069RQ93_PEPLI|nr:M23 family metallopeptidase [Peptoclostridium litorale]KDR96347.1 peptidase M23B [Peptoclostridium litorale DSM 5388]SIO26756.1 Murein DD-endopeptidase MepM and murein hydrolase activator NlpD, contain LysM domain [Peptoclostridium litorale DSM 5388]
MNSDNLNKLADSIKSISKKAKDVALKGRDSLVEIIENAKESYGNGHMLDRFKDTYNKNTAELKKILGAENKWSALNANKNIFYTVTASALIVILAGTAYFSTLNYEVYIDGKMIGIVDKKSEVYGLVEDIKGSVPAQFGEDIKIGQSIEMKRVHVSKAQIIAGSKLEARIRQSIDVQMDAFGIVADGQIVTVVKSEEEANEILQNIKQPYEEDEEGISNREIDFIQEVKIEKVQANIADIKSSEKALTYIAQGTDKLQTYKVKTGDSAWSIARELDIHVSDIEKANPDVNVEKLQIDQQINVTVPKPYISVKTTQEITYEEKIPYEVVYEDTKAMYKGDKKVKEEGYEGVKKIKAKQVKIDGVLASTEIMQENIVQDPKSKIVLNGIKERPKTLAFGSFINPTRGRLSSPFGRRWGKMHEGIDVANSIGTPIYAADGGKVTYSGWKNGYGKVIIINHENGYQTYYAHCSQLDVSNGSRVYRGQKIAAVGNTGRSTGPHLHFEVRKNGTPQNPKKYVSY